MDEVVKRMRLVIRSEVAELHGRGECYPVAFVVDGSSRPARRLMRLLPTPPGEAPHNPGLFGAYPHRLGRDSLQAVLHRGYLLDDPGEADPVRSYWQVMVIQDRLTVTLFVLEDGDEQPLKKRIFPIKT